MRHAQNPALRTETQSTTEPKGLNQSNKRKTEPVIYQGEMIRNKKTSLCVLIGEKQLLHVMHNHRFSTVAQLRSVHVPICEISYDVNPHTSRDPSTTNEPRWFYLTGRQWKDTKTLAGVA